MYIEYNIILVIISNMHYYDVMLLYLINLKMKGGTIMLYCTKCKKFFTKCNDIELKKEETYENPYKIGECLIYGCGGDIVNIDEDMVPIIYIMNDKGYSTKFCCSGHPDGPCGGYFTAYIIIDIEYSSFAEINPHIIANDWKYIEITDIEKDHVSHVKKGIDIRIKRSIFESIIKNDDSNISIDKIFDAYKLGMNLRLEFMEFAKMMKSL